MNKYHYSIQIIMVVMVSFSHPLAFKAMSINMSLSTLPVRVYQRVVTLSRANFDTSSPNAVWGVVGKPFHEMIGQHVVLVINQV